MNKENLKTWNKKKLLETVKALHNSIYNIECYSVSDLLFYDILLNEVNRRNISFEVHETLDFN